MLISTLIYQRQQLSRIRAQLELHEVAVPTIPVEVMGDIYTLLPYLIDSNLIFVLSVANAIGQRAYYEMRRLRQ